MHLRMIRAKPMTMNASVTAAVKRAAGLEVGDRLRFLCGVVLVAVGAATFAVAFRTSLTVAVPKRLSRGQRRRCDDRPPTVAAVGCAPCGGGDCGSHCACARRASTRRQQRHGSRRSWKCAAVPSDNGVPGGEFLGRDRGRDVDRSRGTADRIWRRIGRRDRAGPGHVAVSHARAGGGRDGSRVRGGLQHALCRGAVRPRNDRGYRRSGTVAASHGRDHHCDGPDPNHRGRRAHLRSASVWLAVVPGTGVVRRTRCRRVARRRWVQEAVVLVRDVVRSASQRHNRSGR